ncbi:MAG: DUF3971 domain-containing protein [Alphaproteobacteria bacterium]|nr:DUF3971 domain-containing protein [Alphaproteobacteria bacterium]
MVRFLRFLLKSLATLFGILAVLGMILAWRIATLAARSEDITPYIQTTLSTFEPELRVETGGAFLRWDNRKQILSLQCDKSRLIGPADKDVASFERLEVKVRLWSLIRGRLIPQELNADQAHLWLVRDKNGILSSGLHPDKTEDQKQVEEAVDFLFLQVMADELANPRLRHVIAIKDVAVTVADGMTGQDWTVRMPELRVTHEDGKADGAAKVLVETSEGQSTLDMTYAYEEASKLHHINLSFGGINPSTLAAQRLKLDVLKVADFPLSGKMSVSTDRDLNIASASLALEGGEGFLRDETLWDAPRRVAKVQLKASYDREKKELSVPLAEVDFGGPKLSATLEAQTPTPKDLIWLSNRLESNSFTATVKLDNVPMDSFGAIWPKVAIPDARLWIAQSLTKGLFTHGELTVRGHAKWNDFENIVLESGGGKVYAKDGTVNYLEGMPSIENVSAEASFDLEHMDIKILGGHTGDIKLQPFTLVMDHFQEDTQYITIPAKLAGPAKQVLKVLDAPPLGYAKEIGLDPEDSSGTVEGELTLHMPLLDALLLKDVEVKAQAKIRDFGAAKLVPSIAITAGDFDLDLTKEGFGLKGKAALNTVPAQIVWTSHFGASRKPDVPLHDATINATLKGEQWGLFYGLDSLAKVQGETPTTIRYVNQREGFSQVSGKVVLKQAAVRLKDIGWTKEVGDPVQLAFTLDIPKGKNLFFRSIDLQGPTVKVKGTAELDEASGKLVALSFKPFMLGRSNAEVSYTRPLDLSKPLGIKISGEAFDLNGMEDEAEAAAEKAAEQAKKDPEKDRPKNYTIKLNKLYTSDDGFLSSVTFQAKRDSIGWDQMDLFGVAQGSTPVTIKLMPEAGKLKLSMESDNFGTALQGMGFGSGVQKGQIVVWGESLPDNPRVIKGVVKINDFVIADLPVFARLLSAVSPFGFVDLITGDASFDRLRGEFVWSGDIVDFSDVKAAGSVVGINLDGRLNAGSGEAHLNGTLVPFSFVNSILGAIPLLGDVITGGSGQGVIAAAFTVKGKLSSPDVSVNPVSLLTPGFLRNLFFAGEDTKAGDKKE